MKHRQARSTLCIAGLVAILGTVVGVGSVRASFLPNCNAGPAPQVNWAFCDKTAYGHVQDKDMTGANLSHTKLDGVPFTRTKLVRMRAWSAQFRRVHFYASPMQGSDFTAANFSDALIRGLCSHCTLEDDTGTKWIAALLSHATFEWLNLSGADFTDAVMTDTRLVAGKFDHAKLNGVTLDRAILYGTSLRNASLQGAHMVGVVMHPYLSKEIAGYVPRVDLTGANLTGAVVRLDDTIRGGVERQWEYMHFSNTICPDGTNSDHDAGKTCRGHGFN